MKTVIYLSILLVGMYASAGTGQSKTLPWEERFVKAIDNKEDDGQVNKLLDDIFDEDAESVVLQRKDAESVDYRGIPWKDEQGISVLHWAVRSGNVKAVEYVLKRIREQAAGAVLRHLQCRLEKPVWLGSDCVLGQG